MKKISVLIIYLLFFHIFSPLILVSAVDIKYAGGSGTKEDPYLISNPLELDNVRNNLSSYFKLINDIDLTFDTQNENGRFFNDGKGWNPIGEDFNDFTGNLDGNGFKIIGLKVNRPADNYIGLFGETRSATIKNIIIDNFVINGNSYVGSLVGNAIGSNIEFIASINGNIRGNGVNTGGIVGANQFGSINNSYNTSNIVVNSNIAFGAGGGIAGLNYFGKIEDTFNLGKIVNQKNSTNIGGLVGYHFGGNINNAYNTGTTNFVKITNGNISNAYNLSDVSDILNVEGINYINGNKEAYNGTIRFVNLNDLKKNLTYNVDSSKWLIRDGYLPRIMNLYYIELNSITLTDKNLRFNQLGETKNINYELNPNMPTNNNLVWISSNEKIVTVTDGVAKIVGFGSAKIYVYSQDGLAMDEASVSFLIKGDANGDGKITATDLTKIRRHLAGIESNNDYFDAMDVNSDNKVTATDLTKLRRYLAGLEAL